MWFLIVLFANTVHYWPPTCHDSEFNARLPHCAHFFDRKSNEKSENFVEFSRGLLPSQYSSYIGRRASCRFWTHLPFRRFPVAFHNLVSRCNCEIFSLGRPVFARIAVKSSNARVVIECRSRTSTQLPLLTFSSAWLLA